MSAHSKLEILSQLNRAWTEHVLLTYQEIFFTKSNPAYLLRGVLCFKHLVVSEGPDAGVSADRPLEEDACREGVKAARHPLLFLLAPAPSNGFGRKAEDINRIHGHFKALIAICVHVIESVRPLICRKA